MFFDHNRNRAGDSGFVHPSEIMHFFLGPHPNSSGQVGFGRISFLEAEILFHVLGTSLGLVAGTLENLDGAFFWNGHVAFLTSVGVDDDRLFASADDAIDVGQDVGLDQFVEEDIGSVVNGSILGSLFFFLVLGLLLGLTLFLGTGKLLEAVCGLAGDFVKVRVTSVPHVVVVHGPVIIIIVLLLLIFIVLLEGNRLLLVLVIGDFDF